MVLSLVKLGQASGSYGKSLVSCRMTFPAPIAALGYAISWDSRLSDADYRLEDTLGGLRCQSNNLKNCEPYNIPVAVWPSSPDLGSACEIAATRTYPTADGPVAGIVARFDRVSRVFLRLHHLSPSAGRGKPVWTWAVGGPQKVPDRLG